MSFLTKKPVHKPLVLAPAGTSNAQYLVQYKEEHDKPMQFAQINSKAYGSDQASLVHLKITAHITQEGRTDLYDKTAFKVALSMADQVALQRLAGLSPFLEKGDAPTLPKEMLFKLNFDSAGVAKFDCNFDIFDLSANLQSVEIVFKPGFWQNQAKEENGFYASLVSVYKH
jgi:hypothetical protein